MILNEQQIKDYLIQQITFWTAEIKREEGVWLAAEKGKEECLSAADLREQEAFRWSYEDVYEKLFGVEEFKKAYQDIYDEVYKEI